MDLSRFKFDEQWLLPAVVQDWRDGTVLMVGFMNRDALEKTFTVGTVHFWSRSRQKLWEKGETSGHRLHVKDVFLDCDGDTLLVKADPVGPTCHTGARTCFFALVEADGRLNDAQPADAQGGILERLYQTTLDRKRHPQEGSYVSKLFQGGHDRIAKKVVEEAGEVVIASKNASRDEVVYEVADLVFHTLLILGYHEIPPSDIYAELAKRHGKSGLRTEPKESGA